MRLVEHSSSFVLDGEAALRFSPEVLEAMAKGAAMCVVSRSEVGCDGLDLFYRLRAQHG